MSRNLPITLLIMNIEVVTPHAHLHPHQTKFFHLLLPYSVWQVEISDGHFPVEMTADTVSLSATKNVIIKLILALYYEHCSLVHVWHSLFSSFTIFFWSLPFLLLIASLRRQNIFEERKLRNTERVRQKKRKSYLRMQAITTTRLTV